jgi:hypothetical protein
MSRSLLWLLRSPSRPLIAHFFMRDMAVQACDLEQAWPSTNVKSCRNSSELNRAPKIREAIAEGIVDFGPLKQRPGFSDNRGTAVNFVSSR